jgi:hypothetical protein
MSHRRTTESHDLEALAWACGIGPEEASILAAPAAEPGARFAKDRAAVAHDLEALAWACGIGPEEASILAAPAAEPGARFAKDRAAVAHDLEALAWACGIGPEEASILAVPAAEPGARFAKDRAAVVTTAILQIVRDELTAWAHREPANIAGVHEAIESFLRDEFDAHARATLNEIRLNDE